MEKYNVAANTGIITKPGQKPDFGPGLKPDELSPWQRKTRHELTRNMQNVSLTAAGIASVLNRGGTVTTPHTGGPDCRYCAARNWTCYSRSHRCNDNFLDAPFLGADFDKLENADQVLENIFVKNYASIIYHTASSTPQKPKMRAIFLLSDTVTSGPLYREMNLAMMWKLEGLPDKACKDYCRLWYGNQGSTPTVTGNILPIETAMELRAEWLAGPGRPKVPEHITVITKPRTGTQTEQDRRREAFGKAVLTRARDKIRAAVEGDRHETLKNQAYNVFSFVKGGIIDREEAERTMLEAYPAYDRGDGPDLLEWIYDNAPVNDMPEDKIFLDFSRKPAPKLNFTPKTAPKLNFGGKN